MSNRRLVAVSALAAAVTLAFAAIVFAGSLGEIPPVPAAPAPLPAPVVAPAPAIAPAPPPLPPSHMGHVAAPAPPAPPARAHRIHAGDTHVRFAGETLVVESDGDTWVIEDRATVRRFREIVRSHEAHAREMTKLVETMAPTIAAAEAIGREFEDDEMFRDLEREIERDVEAEVGRALALAEVAGARAEAIVKRHEASLRQMERELERFEKEIEALEKTLDDSGDDLEDELDEILEEAFEKGRARRID